MAAAALALSSVIEVAGATRSCAIQAPRQRSPRGDPPTHSQRCRTAPGGGPPTRSNRCADYCVRCSAAAAQARIPTPSSSGPQPQSGCDQPLCATVIPSTEDLDPSPICDSVNLDFFISSAAFCSRRRHHTDHRAAELTEAACETRYVQPIAKRLRNALCLTLVQSIVSRPADSEIQLEFALVSKLNFALASEFGRSVCERSDCIKPREAGFGDDFCRRHLARWSGQK